jgi:hypothetical protein
VKKIIMGGLAAVLAGGAAVAIAGTPMGGDDLGIIPTGPNAKAILKCETGLGKGGAKLAASIIKCHQGVVTGKVTDEEGCENTAKSNFIAKAKLTGCDVCSSASGLANLVEGLVDGHNDSVYCAAGTPWPATAETVADTGNVPADAPKGPISKCENLVAKGAGKLIGAIAKCHASEAAGKLVGDSAEEPCETAAIAKFTALGPKTTGCDPCTNLTTIAGVVATQSDNATAVVFCSNSPSGAFLE